MDRNDLMSSWDNAVSAHDYRKALTLAIDGLNVATNGGSDEEFLQFLGMLRISSDRLFDQMSQRKSAKGKEDDVCGFCGQQKPLKARGLKTGICDACLSSLSRLATGKDET